MSKPKNSEDRNPADHNPSNAGVPDRRSRSSLGKGYFAEISPARETSWFIGFVSPDDITATLRRIRSAGGIVTDCLCPADLARVDWNQGVLGKLVLDRKVAIELGVRYVPYDQIEPLSFNSATFGVPDRKAAKYAFIVATSIVDLAQSGEVKLLERLVSDVSKEAFITLCGHYLLSPSETETIFDDNATLALYQFMGSLTLGTKTLALYNTGRVMPLALRGINPKFAGGNFAPNVDIWGNALPEPKEAKIGPFDLLTVPPDIEHFGSNAELHRYYLEEIREHRPDVIVVNTVTRLGRRLQFVDLCKKIRKEFQDSNYSPLIILDDAQGFSRLDRKRYLTDSRGRKSRSIWDYADALLLTGAKTAGALMGSGAILFSRRAFEQRQLPFSNSPLVLRSRRYAFVSLDAKRMREYNRVAPGIANTPEISSLTPALEGLTWDVRTPDRLKELRTIVVSRLRRIQGVKVLENRQAQYVDSIVAFTLTGDLKKEGAKVKRMLAEPRDSEHEWGQLPITIPALITNKGRDYLRIALNPRAVQGGYGLYKRKVLYLLRNLEATIKVLVDQQNVSDEETKKEALDRWPDIAEGLD